jgi:hypothetical protein
MRASGLETLELTIYALDAGAVCRAWTNSPSHTIGCLIGVRASRSQAAGLAAQHVPSAPPPANATSHRRGEVAGQRGLLAYGVAGFMDLVLTKVRRILPRHGGEFRAMPLVE